MSSEFVVIMAGGRGERFWPASRLRKPKHLLPIVGDEPMLRQTLDRLPESIPASQRLIITNAEQVEAVREICPELPEENVVAEPVGRDTAAAVGLAALLVHRRNPEAVFAILPADAVIHDRKAFREVVADAFRVARSGDFLVTVGIQPTYPATGYGYIHKGNALEGEQQGAWQVQRFVEKPDLDTAQQYLDSGEYFWNAGMFIWQANSILQAIQKFVPQLDTELKQIRQKLEQGEALAPVLTEVYPTLTKISIDYAVMEKADNVVTVPSTFDWDDVGEWPALVRHEKPDAQGNIRKGDTFLLEASNNLVLSSPNHVVTLLGVDDLIVVHTPDATLICPKDKAQEIKKLVQGVQAEERFSHLK